MTLEDVLKDLCNEALNKSNIDWYNNDGGQGHMTIDFAADPVEIELDVEQNVTSVIPNKFVFSHEDGTIQTHNVGNIEER